MSKFRILISFCALLYCNSELLAQSESKNLKQTHFFSLSPNIQTNGYGINLKWSPAALHSRFWFYSIDLGRIKHKKEFRYIGNARYNGFVFGRKNVVLPVRLGLGKHYVLSVRNNKNDVGVSWSYQFGASMALLKPVYLYIDEMPGSLSSVEKLVKYDGEKNIGLDNIVGGASFFVGVNQMHVVPGAYGKVAMLFSWGKYYSDYHALEVGAITEIYSKALPIMASTHNNFIFPAFYINLNLGKFW